MVEELDGILKCRPDFLEEGGFARYKGEVVHCSGEIRCIKGRAVCSNFKARVTVSQPSKTMRTGQPNRASIHVYIPGFVCILGTRKACRLSLILRILAIRLGLHGDRKKPSVPPARTTSSNFYINYRNTYQPSFIFSRSGCKLSHVWDETR